MSKIIRSKYRTAPFVAVNQSLAEHPKLTWQAKGLMLYLMSRPPTWIVRVSHLASAFPLGRDGVRAIINELIEFGYVARIPGRRLPNGQISGCDYIFDDDPNNVERHLKDLARGDDAGAATTGAGEAGAGHGVSLVIKEDSNKGSLPIKDRSNKGSRQLPHLIVKDGFYLKEGVTTTFVRERIAEEKDEDPIEY